MSAERAEMVSETRWEGYPWRKDIVDRVRVLFVFVCFCLLGGGWGIGGQCAKVTKKTKI